VRLIIPSDLGEVLKPFVFLDLFEADMGQMRDAMALHPHSGIATVTVFIAGDVRFDGPNAGEGTIACVEWLRAGGGAWHGKELSPGASPRAQGFQL
jgi:redox-sensitive bicupin YhaK (pirin superfamily)